MKQEFLLASMAAALAVNLSFLPPLSMLSDEEYAKLAAAQNSENAAWNAAEAARIEAYNKKAAEENKTAEAKKALRQFKPRAMVTAAQYKEPFGSDYRAMVKEVRECLAVLSERFPGYKNQGYEIGG